MIPFTTIKTHISRAIYNDTVVIFSREQIAKLFGNKLRLLRQTNR